MKLLKPVNLKEIITALKNGAVLVLPTDTVYGLVCDAKNKKAVEKIFEIKKRDKAKPLAVFVKDIDTAKKYAVIGKKEEEFLKDSKTTVVVLVKSGLAQLIGGTGKIGIRIPDYDLIKNIFSEFDGPLAQTSANISGQPATTKIREVILQFKNQDILIIDAGDLPEAKPSKVVDLTGESDKIIRE